MHENEVAREVLLAEVRWLRGLARELVADPSQRDDLVQTTMVQALRAPPRSADRRSLRAWLRRVLENANRSLHRSRERALDRERLAARLESGESVGEPVVEVVARAELSRKLLELVLALDARSRDVLLLRYFRGLDTAAIAARLQCSEEVVRQRQSRALAQLREKTRDDRDLRELVAAAGWLPRATKVLPRVMIGAACGSLAIVAACLGPELIAEPAGRPTLARVEAGSSGASESPAASASLETPGAREPSAAEATADWLALTIRDTRSGAPIAGATVARARAKDWDEVVADVEADWDRHGISGVAGRYLGLAREEATPAEPGTESTPPFAPKDESVLAHSGVDGSVRLATELPREEFLVVRAPGRGPRYLPVREVESLAEKRVTVDLNPTGELPVHVHTLDGEDVEDAFLRVEAIPYLPEFRPQRFLPLVDGLAWRGPTDADGKWTLTEVPLDEALAVTPLSRCLGKSADVLLQAGAASDPLDFVVAPPGGAVGRVVDHEGVGLAGMSMIFRPRRPWGDRAVNLTTDEAGLFRITGMPAGRSVLECWPERRAGRDNQAQVEFEVTLEPYASVDLGELVVTGGSPCLGRVSGLPAPGSGVNCFVECIQGARSQRLYLGSTRSFAFEGLPGPARVVVGVASDWAGGSVLLSRELNLPAEDLVLDVTPNCATLAFRLPASEAALAGVHLYDRTRFGIDGTPKWEGAISRYQLTPSEGAYRIEVLPPGSYRLELQAPRGAKSFAADVVLEAGKVRDLGAIDLGSGSITGTVTRAPAESLVRAMRRLPGSFGRGAFGEDHFDEHTAPIDPDGSFRFTDLPAGLWCVTARGPRGSLHPGKLVDLRVGGAERVALEASPAPRVRCRVRRGDTPVIGAVAEWSFDDPEAMRPFFELILPGKPSLSGPDGLIDLGEFFPGQYRVQVLLNGEPQSQRTEVTWGEDQLLDFDFGGPEFAVRLELPEPWSSRLTSVTFHPRREASDAGVRETMLTRRAENVFALRSTPGEGLLNLGFSVDREDSDAWLPVRFVEGERTIVASFPPGEIVIRSGDAATGAHPRLEALVVSEREILDPGGRLGPWPLEPLSPGVWVARGIPERSTFLLGSAVAGDPRHRGEPTRRLEFESGRLEVEWP